MSFNNVAIVISSFDGFSDCWDPFLHGFKKYWKDCRYNVYLVTNYENSPDENILPSIKVGTDYGWSSNMIKALSMINEEYIIYLQEDYWLKKHVNQELIASILELMRSNSWDYFRLVPIPGPDKLLDGEFYGITDSTSKYQVCLQAAIWRKKSFLNMLHEGESGWDFEIKSSKRVMALDLITFCINKRHDKNYPISYCSGTAIRKARWTQGAINYIRNENLDFDISQRKVESSFENWLLRISGECLILKIGIFLIIRTLQFLRGERKFGTILKR